MSEVRGRSREDPMPEGQRQRGVTPRPRSGAVAESTRLQRHRNGREELPRVRGQAGQARGDTQCPRSGAATRGVTPRPRSGAVAGRSYPMPPHLRPGAAAKRSYPTSEVRVSGQEYPTATAEERPRGATPHPRSGGAAKRRYPASKVRGHDERSYPVSEVRGGDKRSHQRPRSGAVAGRRYPTPQA